MLNNQKWTQIIIQDPDFLSGSSINTIYNLLIENLKFKYVIINDIEGSGRDWIVNNLQKQENVILEVFEIKKSLLSIKQLDWGDFFFFSERPLHWENLNDGYYPILIKQSQTLLRAVDNQYFYIYCPSEKVVNIVQSGFVIENIKEDILENLDYPY